ncbi:DUF2783 domain-containing protein [Shimia sp. MMG029]|uniref:DUF2783 domain-containing protein n=1 Tax=Shimia sp. MMG029 TaxID=3021978 RepID=UPI0022FEA5F3|nr:DUF2783 domain-containing protein [Shimia sp. MMG029]MDA5557293.1 DUF2783 domain-containing protein [Shimia sp. MMG029]
MSDPLSKTLSETLTLTPNFEDADAFFAALTQAHTGLTRAESDALNARLIFVLANHIGGSAALNTAIATAKAAHATA